MVTDDPGTPGNGHWEINIASLYVSQPNELLAQFPYFDIHANTFLNGLGTDTLLNFGIRYSFNEHMNLLAALGHTVTHDQDSSTEFESYLGLQLEL
jgi:hypothetical protein